MDTARAARVARSAQLDFEYGRVAALPSSKIGEGKCEERLGNYCYWYDPTEPDPPEEPDAVQRSRARLISRLRELAAEAPQNGWISGQLVRYLVEQGSPDSALAAARQCGGEPWWCSALAGFALHNAQEYAAADSAFALALGRMPEGARCRWMDLTPVLEPDLLPAYRQLSCAERDSADDHLFWLGRPRVSERANDLRTEHFARWTYVTSLENAITYHGIPLDQDIREMMVRYAWATAWSRREGRRGFAGMLGGGGGGTTIISHEPKPAYSFLPVRVETGDGGGGDVEWELERRLPKSRYHPRWATEVRHARDLLLSRFSRGDSMVVVAAFDAGTAPGYMGDSARARLGISESPRDVPLVVQRQAPGGRGVLLARLPTPVSGLLGIEIADPRSGGVALRRAILAPVDPSGPRLSDVLLFKPGERLPETLEEAAGAALTTSTFTPGETIGLYWEVYGVPAGGDSLAVSVAVEEQTVTGAKQPIGRARGRSSRPPPIRLTWSGGRQGPPALPEAIELDLTTLERGRYWIVVQVEVGGRPPLRSEREITIEDRR